MTTPSGRACLPPAGDAQRPLASRRFPLIAPLVLSLGLAAASKPAMAATVSADPYEGANRAFYGLESALDRALLRPLSVFYRHAVPRPIRAGLTRVAGNLGEPGVAANDLLQGRTAKAGRTVVRFVANSTLGLGGLIDVASTAGLKHHDNDLGLTLARYGVGSGPYLYLPLVGPTNVRDGAANLVTIALNPLTYIGYPGQSAVSLTTTATGGLEKRASVDDQLKSLDALALDPYATVRAYAQQNRESEIHDGVVQVDALPDFDPAPDFKTTPVAKIAAAAAVQDAGT